jgi:hypothetical protein
VAKCRKSEHTLLEFDVPWKCGIVVLTETCADRVLSGLEFHWNLLHVQNLAQWCDPSDSSSQADYSEKKLLEPCWKEIECLYDNPA